MSVLLLSIIVSSASGIFIELESSTIGSEPKEYSATLSNSASVSNSVSVHNAAGIKQSERNWETFLTWIQSKQKQTTTVGQTIDQGSTSHESKLDIGQWANFARGGTPRKNGWGCAARFPKPLPYLWPKPAKFPTLFMTWPLNQNLVLTRL